MIIKQKSRSRPPFISKKVKNAKASKSTKKYANAPQEGTLAYYIVKVIFR